ncbi:hypothetical protein FisN_13Hh327 [Fistulifera solaris]|uniref:Uncharacterized protein n=1 Tax=Fistulifera solaris TaxID=1519565 RepID=A0A1Z5KNA0_FISSO|nr:hypothetical protein FisN_13Hh327 [Fistulifera solaris]|eukprot:GAX27585.1 hypothetical protein FisN_13Hh327 [Fistulifera solaris]
MHFASSFDDMLTFLLPSILFAVCKYRNCQDRFCIRCQHKMSQSRNEELPIAFANAVNNDEATHYDSRGEISAVSTPAELVALEVPVMAVESGEDGDYRHVVDEGTIVAENVVATDEVAMESLLKKNEELQKEEIELLSQLRTHLESPEIFQSTRGELLASLIDKTKQLQQFQEQQRKILMDACDQRYRYSEILRMQGELRVRQNEVKYHLQTILWLQGKASKRPSKRSLRISRVDGPGRHQDPTTAQRIAAYCKILFWWGVILMVLFAAVNIIIAVVYEVTSNNDNGEASLEGLDGDDRGGGRGLLKLTKKT